MPPCRRVFQITFEPKWIWTRLSVLRILLKIVRHSVSTLKFISTAKFSLSWHYILLELLCLNPLRLIKALLEIKSIIVSIRANSLWLSSSDASLAIKYNYTLSFISYSLREPWFISLAILVNNTLHSLVHWHTSFKLGSMGLQWSISQPLCLNNSYSFIFPFLIWRRNKLLVINCYLTSLYRGCHIFWLIYLVKHWL